MPTFAEVLDRLSSIDNARLRHELQRDVRRFASIVRNDGEPRSQRSPLAGPIRLCPGEMNEPAVKR